MRRMIPEDVLAESRQKARNAIKEGRPTNRLAAAGIVGVWALLAVLVVFLVGRVLGQVDRLSLASFAAICAAVSGLLLLDATGMVALDPLPRRALE